MICTIKHQKILGYSYKLPKKIMDGCEVIAVPNSKNIGIGQKDPRLTMTPEEKIVVQKLTLSLTRKINEQKGVLWNGNEYHSDPESQARLANTMYALDKGMLTAPISWKTKNGTFVTLSAVDIGALAQAIAQHVEAQFNSEKTALEAL